MTPDRKLVYTVIIISVFCIFIACGMGNFRSKQLAVNLAGEQVYTVISRTAENIDSEKLQEVIKSRDIDHPYYIDLQQKFSRLREENNLANIYILTKNELGKWCYVVDGRNPSDPQFHPLWEVESYAPVAVEKAIRGKIIKGEYYRNPLGTFVSSFIEIQDSKGTAIAVIGGDFDASAMTRFLYITRYAQMAVLTAGFILIGCAVILRKRKG